VKKGLNSFGKSYSSLQPLRELQEFLVENCTVLEPVLKKFGVPEEVEGLGKVGPELVIRLWVGMAPASHAYTHAVVYTSDMVWFSTFTEILQILESAGVSTAQAVLFIRHMETVLLQVVSGKSAEFITNIQDTRFILEQNIKQHYKQE